MMKYKDHRELQYRCSIVVDKLQYLMVTIRDHNEHGNTKLKLELADAIASMLNPDSTVEVINK